MPLSPDIKIALHNKLSDYIFQNTNPADFSNLILALNAILMNSRPPEKMQGKVQEIRKYLDDELKTIDLQDRAAFMNFVRTQLGEKIGLISKLLDLPLQEQKEWIAKQQINECPICHELLETDIFIAPVCKHKFHKTCMADWESAERGKSRGLTCPICRAVITPNLPIVPPPHHAIPARPPAAPQAAPPPAFDPLTHPEIRPLIDAGIFPADEVRITAIFLGLEGLLVQARALNHPEVRPLIDAGIFPAGEARTTVALLGLEGVLVQVRALNHPEVRPLVDAGILSGQNIREFVRYGGPAHVLFLARVINDPRIRDLMRRGSVTLINIRDEYIRIHPNTEQDLIHSLIARYRLIARHR